MSVSCQLNIDTNRISSWPHQNCRKPAPTVIHRINDSENIKTNKSLHCLGPIHLLDYLLRNNLNRNPLEQENIATIPFLSLFSIKKSFREVSFEHLPIGLTNAQIFYYMITSARIHQEETIIGINTKLFHINATYGPKKVFLSFSLRMDFLFKFCFYFI